MGLSKLHSLDTVHLPASLSPVGLKGLEEYVQVSGLAVSTATVKVEETHTPKRLMPGKLSRLKQCNPFLEGHRELNKGDH